MDLWSSVNNTVVVFNDTYEGVRGTPFYSDSWSKGTIVLIDDTRYEELELKYNMYEDIVLLKNKTGGAIIPNQSFIQEFHLEDSLGVDHKFIKIRFGDDKIYAEDMSGFFELLYDGENTFIVKRKKYMQPADYTGAYSANKPYDEFRESASEYYWIDKLGKITEFNKGKKNVLRALNDDGELAQFVREEKLALKNEKDLILLIAYFDSVH